MKYLRKIFLGLLYLLPAVLFFSYYPIIPLGANSSMNFELSLPLIWLVLFDFTAFIVMLSSAFKKPRVNQATSQNRPRDTGSNISNSSKSVSPVSASATNKGRTALHDNRRTKRAPERGTSAWGPNLPGISDRRFFLFSLFPLYLTISVFWSANPLRGLLTAGVMWLVFFAIFAIIYIVPLAHPPQTLRRNILISLFASTTLVCLFCFAQSILDLCGFSRESTLLCAGCTYRSFGFPHPSGFAIEPQFMGNLLLAPTLVSLWLLVRQGWEKDNHSNKTNPAEPSKITNKETRAQSSRQSKSKIFWTIAILAFLFSTTLFFTFSRGAIYAYAVALLVLISICLKRHFFRWSLIAIPVASFLVSLGLQGTFAAIGPTPETFISGVTKSIHQLSLGIIDLRPSSVAVENSASTVENTSSSVDNSSENVEKSSTDSGKLVENIPTNGGKPAQNSEKSVNNSPESVENPANITNNSPESFSSPGNETSFDGYVAESTNIRLNLNGAALDTWLSAPGHPSIGIDAALRCYVFCCPCVASGPLTPTSILFGVGLGGAGTALYQNRFITHINSPKEIVQNEFFSLLLETGLVGILLFIFTLLLAFFPRLFSAKFLDGKSANPQSSSKSALQSSQNVVKPPKSASQALSTHVPESDSAVSAHASREPSRAISSSFWHHPAMPLLLSLIIAYLITLNFFSGLPNALQIYLMPPLLYLIFSPYSELAQTRPPLLKTSKPLSITPKPPSKSSKSRKKS